MIRVVIEACSKADLPLSKSFGEALDRLGVQSILRVASTSKDSTQRNETVKEHEGNYTYSSLINIQKRIKQYLSMANETDSQEAGRL